MSELSRAQAAARLGVPEWRVSDVAEHPAGHLATLRDGTVMLIAETVARVYLPEVDDVADDVADEEPAGDGEPAAKPAKKAASKKAAPRKASGAA